MLKACGNANYYDELIHRLRSMPAKDATAMLTMVQGLAERKADLYADDLRLVGDWALRDVGNGEVSLRAVAHAPPKS